MKEPFFVCDLYLPPLNLLHLCQYRIDVNQFIFLVNLSILMLNSYLHCSLKFSGFSESVINKIVAFLMSDCFDCFLAWKVSESRLIVFRQVRLNGAGRKPFTQVSCRIMNGPGKFGSCWHYNAYKLLVGGYLLVLAAYIFSQVLDSF